MDAHFKAKSYRPTEDEAKGHQEGKREKKIIVVCKQLIRDVDTIASR